MDQAVKHCEAGIGLWDWASNDADGSEPDVVMACAGDVPTLETIAAVSLLRKHVPDLKIRVVNVVDVMTLQPKDEHPHGISDAEFDGLFTRLVSAGLPSVGSLRLPNGSSQWILGAFVQSTYSVAVESLLVDFKIRAQEILKRKLLDCKANRFRGPAKSLITHWPLCVADPCREQFRRGIIIKGIHVF
jgi:hypothetical protein